MPKSLVGWAFLLVVVILLVKNPTGTAAVVKHAWDSLATFVSSLATFVSSLAA